MKLMIISDTHGSTQRMVTAIERGEPDAVLHLGDYISDTEELKRQKPNLELYAVRGNGDFWAMGEDELLLTLGGVGIYMVHGHKFGVKSGLDSFVKRARMMDASLALYGHTHIADIRQADGLCLMNPGQMMQNSKNRPATYGMVTVADGVFTREIIRLATQD